MTKHLCPVLLFAVACLDVSAQSTTSLLQYEAVYDESLRKIENDYQSRVVPLNEAYRKSLVRNADKVKADGNLEAALQFKLEQKRFIVNGLS